MTKNLLKTIPWPDLLGDHLGHVNWEVKQKREVENGDHSIYQSEVDPKGDTDGADFNGSLQSTEEKTQEIATQLWEEKQMNEELTRQRISLQAEEASLQHENSQLERETQQLSWKHQILPDLYQENIT